MISEVSSFCPDVLKAGATEGIDTVMEKRQSFLRLIFDGLTQSAGGPGPDPVVVPNEIERASEPKPNGSKPGEEPSKTTEAAKPH